MQATNGIGCIIENRYYGKSFPVNSSTTDELAYMTTEQSMYYYSVTRRCYSNYIQQLPISHGLPSMPLFRESKETLLPREPLGFCMVAA